MFYKMFHRLLLICGSFLSILSSEAQQFASELQLSTEDTVYWYRICNALPDMQDYVMTDCSNQDYNYQVQLLQTEMNEEYSQWKLTAVGNNGKVVLTNRATGSQLGGMSMNLGNHNSTKLIANGSPGFTITPLGDNAFSLQGVEDDGVERCLALAERNSPALAWPEENLSVSAIGWKFMIIESKGTGIMGVKTKTDVYLIGKRIYVNGCSKWQLFNLHGKEIDRSTILTAGIYIVKTPNEVFKVMIP